MLLSTSSRVITVRPRPHAMKMQSHTMHLGELLLMAFCGLLAVVAPAFAQTWTQTSAPSNDGWVSVASSADGNKLVATSTGLGVYTSTNSGGIWTQQTSAPNLEVVASAADGAELVAGDFASGIYTSTNSGIAWTQQTNAPQINAVASSADGVKLAAAGFPSCIYTST